MQRQNNNIKNDHKREIENINRKLSSRNDEIFYLRNHNKTPLAKMKKFKNEKKMQHKTQTMNKGTNIDSINVEKPNVIINEVLLVKELPKTEFKKQFNDKETSID